MSETISTKITTTTKLPNRLLIRVTRKTRKRKPTRMGESGPSKVLKTQKKRELNRISARKSREKKKMYISQMEREVGELRQERTRLIKLVNTLNDEVQRYKKESNVGLFLKVLNDKFGIQPGEFANQIRSSFDGKVDQEYI
ncbi:ccaat/enhancer-binding protein-related [Anaeramoeba flamelloides]|uniref:Ccaat/enhancer-binding protein-related n=1 Tax=Anaeramoeba flamelloides TaxID=1746091 RepID=A0AAV7YMZ1_9EUKA|nr:ccaat/enhancer-binding protein-related [Anaeramoeba flamelloides]KAJ6247231.1 ccaat/enhancer-binding protein-related [Anaeramoeba flamelloides]|eukprot:Anaeramoba_flamelloidesa568137_66.p2 GENE.a568137_66~~a568137_66.p2  ORF type:complete len:141 (+),score=7.79 a568137_66:110-532(+)